MKQFDLLVGEQLKTMDELLDLQRELEEYQQTELACVEMKDEVMLVQVRMEIGKKQEQLRAVQQMFEKQTVQVIESFQQEKLIYH